MVNFTDILKNVDLKKYIPIDSTKVINKSGAIIVKTCPICGKKDHFWINKNKYGSFAECCQSHKGGDLWDWYVEYEGLSKKDARQRIINELNIDNPLGKDLIHLNQNLKLDKNIKGIMENEVSEMFDLLHENARIIIKVGRDKNIYSRLMEILVEKKSLDEKYHCIKWIEGSFNI